MEIRIYIIFIITIVINFDPTHTILQVVMGKASRDKVKFSLSPASLLRAKDVVDLFNIIDYSIGRHIENLQSNSPYGPDSVLVPPPSQCRGKSLRSQMLPAQAQHHATVTNAPRTSATPSDSLDNAPHTSTTPSDCLTKAPPAQAQHRATASQTRPAESQHHATASELEPVAKKTDVEDNHDSQTNERTNGSVLAVIRLIRCF